ncbi:MAG: hypothetical protein BGO10_02415 [Chlamydia sp. 32-24]|mgnify:CR=1 FL=1|nr:MAG: hypothetical protein BGO10_02415 [Chlamydia sp. 32-24]
MKKYDLIISFSDLIKIIKKNKYKIYFGSLSFALLFLFSSLLKTASYEVEASFREKGKSSAGFPSSLSAFIGSGLSNESSALTTIKSRKLLEKLVEKANLQSQISPKPFFESSLLNKVKQAFTNVYENIRVQMALWNHSSLPCLKDCEKPPLKAIDVAYNGEIPLSYYLEITDDEKVFVKDSNNKVLGQSEIGLPFHLDLVSFTIIKNDDAPLNKKEWQIKIFPLQTIVGFLNHIIQIDNDRLDKNLLKIRMSLRDRYLAKDLINQLMEVYQNHLRDEQSRISSEQIAYLEKRQKEMDSSLKSIMDKYADMISKDVFCTGFPDTNKAIDFLAKTQNSYKEKLLNLDLEIKRLQRFQEDHTSYNVFLDTEVVKDILDQIRELKLNSNTLEIALREESPLSNEEKTKGFQTQIATAKEIKEQKEFLELYLEKLKKENFAIPPQPLLDNQKYLINEWFSKIESLHNLAQNSSQKNTFDYCLELDICKKNFISYLETLLNYLNVKDKVLHDKLAFEQTSQDFFLGIDLETAKHLYLEYSKELDKTEAEIVQHNFILQQMGKDDFEISSLSSILTDTISTQMIQRASEIVLSLKDEHNRSQKEQERLKEQIKVQKGFLEMHLQQIIQLLELKKGLEKEKIYSLQNAAMVLMHQQISILENQLKEYLANRLKNIKHEKGSLEQHQDSIKSDMSSLPSKWVAEKLVQKQVETNQKLIEELTKLVESKNISSNLEMVQSAPLDYPIAPLHPKSPRLIFYFLLGGILGGLLTTFFIISRSIIQGLPVTEENLRLMGQQVAGKLSTYFDDENDKPINDFDLSTLRHLANFIEKSKLTSGNKLFALINGNGKPFYHSLAQILSKKGWKVLLVPLSFDRIQPFFEGDEKKSLLNYLNGSIEIPKIFHKDSYDYITQGGLSRYSTEILSKSIFKNLLNEYCKEYDVVIGISNSLPTSADAEALSLVFSDLIINLKDEKIPEIEKYYSSKDKNIFFVIS